MSEYNKIELSGKEEKKKTKLAETIAIGNFDGVHLGHQWLLRKGLDVSTIRPLSVLTFSPHPRVFFGSLDGSSLLTTEKDKLLLLSAFGVKKVYNLTFDSTVSCMSAVEFCEFLHEMIGCRSVVVGEGFRFGKDRLGSSILLEKFFDTCHVVPCYRVGKEVCQSSKIREYIVRGWVREASLLLGRYWRVRGLVEKGSGLGEKALGVATANMSIEKVIHPAFGVYMSYIRLSGGKKVYKGVVNFGKAPTMKSDKPPVLEAHLLDYHEASSLQGKKMDVYFVGYLRPEEKFSNKELLKKRIQEDIALSKKRFTKIETILPDMLGEI